MPFSDILADGLAAARAAPGRAAPDDRRVAAADAGALAERPPFELYVRHGTEAGLAWTLLRKRVFRTIWSADRPVGAYEVAERLGDAGRPVSAVTVYRCLGAFEQAGLVVPLVSLKRYLLAPDPAAGPWAFLLCRVCGSCSPVDLRPARDRLERKLRAAGGFQPRRYAVEWHGLCRACIAAASGEAA